MSDKRDILFERGATLSLLTFDQFTVPLLYEVLALRAEVFVVEQNCPYQDLDGMDQPSHHLMMRLGGELVGYLRLIPPGTRFATPTLGRFIIREPYRRDGLGRALLRRAIAHCEGRWGKGPISLSGQAYLKEFYESEGFVAVDGPYLEDGIPHYEMIRS